MPTIEISDETAGLLAQYLALRSPQMIDAESGEIVPASAGVAADMLLNMALCAEMEAIYEKRGREAARLQEIAGNPFDDEDRALFEMFRRERFTPEQQRDYILEQARAAGRASDRLYAALLNMVLQHCAAAGHERGELESYAITANAEAMQILAEAGYLVIHEEIGRHVLASRPQAAGSLADRGERWPAPRDDDLPF